MTLLDNPLLLSYHNHLFVCRTACYCVLFWIQWPGTCLILELGILVLVPSSFSESGCRPKMLWVTFTFYFCCNIAQLANLLTSLHDLLLCRFWPCLVVPGWVTRTSLVSTWPHCHMKPWSMLQGSLLNSVPRVLLPFPPTHWGKHTHTVYTVHNVSFIELHRFARTLISSILWLAS